MYCFICSFFGVLCVCRRLKHLENGMTGESSTELLDPGWIGEIAFGQLNNFTSKEIGTTRISCLHFEGTVIKAISSCRNTSTYPDNIISSE